MLGDLLVWIGVALAACAAWKLYTATGSGAEDQDTLRRDD
jgi:hypothetical protein